MLYSLLFAVIALAVLMPIVGIACFIEGYNLKAEKTGEKPIKKEFIPKKQPKGNPEIETLLHNINQYDGTSNGQREFE